MVNTFTNKAQQIDGTLQFRLSKIDKIKHSFIKEIREREMFCLRYLLFL